MRRICLLLAVRGWLTTKPLWVFNRPNAQAHRVVMGSSFLKHSKGRRTIQMKSRSKKMMKPKVIRRRMSAGTLWACNNRKGIQCTAANQPAFGCITYYIQFGKKSAKHIGNMCRHLICLLQFSDILLQTTAVSRHFTNSLLELSDSVPYHRYSSWPPHLCTY